MEFSSKLIGIIITAIWSLSIVFSNSSPFAYNLAMTVNIVLLLSMFIPTLGTIKEIVEVPPWLRLFTYLPFFMMLCYGWWISAAFFAIIKFILLGQRETFLDKQKLKH